MELSYGTVYKTKRSGKLKYILLVLILAILMVSLSISKLSKMEVNTPEVVHSKTNNVYQSQKSEMLTPTFMEIRNTITNQNVKDLYSHSSEASPFIPVQPVKTAYLTFDDGPSKKITPKVLALLKSQNIKANFFVIGQLCKYNPELVKMERDEGHTVCNHTYSHDYKTIYKNPSAFLKDVNKCDDILKSILGQSFNCRIVRFPAGGYGKKYIPYKQLLEKENYKYMYWDVESGDAEGQNVPVEKQLERIKSEVELKYISKKQEIVILMHDSFNKETTLEALPLIIEYLKSKGYEFKTFPPIV